MALQLVLVAARAANGVIGRDGSLPWHIPADLRRFKALTMGKPMIMGRRTFDSLGGPLAGRRHIVLTRDPAWSAPGAERAGSVAQALALAGESGGGGGGPGEVAVIGGGEVFALLLDRAARIELTEVHAEIAGDTRMPPLGTGWRETFREEHAARDGGPAFAFVTLTRHL